MLVAATNHIMQDIPVDDILAFRSQMLDYFHKNQAALCDQIETSGVMSDDDKQAISTAAEAFLADYQSKNLKDGE